MESRRGQSPPAVAREHGTNRLVFPSVGDSPLGDGLSVENRSPRCYS